MKHTMSSKKVKNDTKTFKMFCIKLHKTQY